MFRLRVWNKHLKEIDTIERPSAGDLLDMGKRLQKEYGAFYRLEFPVDVPLDKRVGT